MKNSAFEKAIWGVTFLFCTVMLTGHQASASTGTVAEMMQNPTLYAIGLLVTYVGAKLFSPSGGQF